MAYSTCSFNPIEDEAVVADLLRRCRGAVTLEDASHLLPDLRRGPGFKTWEVYDELGNSYPTFESSQKGDRARLFKPSMWPPGAESQAGKKKQKRGGGGDDHEGFSPPLERCLRLYPHLQDTGGFFVALLRKTRTLDRKQGKNKQEGGDEGEYKQRRGCEHLRYAAVSGDAVKHIQEGVGLTGMGMASLQGCLFTRSQAGKEGGVRGAGDEIVHFTKETAACLFGGKGCEKLKTVCGGTVLCKKGEGGKYGLSQEAVPLVMGLIDTARVVTGTRTDLAHLLEHAGRYRCTSGLSFLSLHLYLSLNFSFNLFVFLCRIQNLRLHLI